MFLCFSAPSVNSNLNLFTRSFKPPCHLHLAFKACHGNWLKLCFFALSVNSILNLFLQPIGLNGGQVLIWRRTLKTLPQNTLTPWNEWLFRFWISFSRRRTSQHFWHTMRLANGAWSNKGCLPLSSYQCWLNLWIRCWLQKCLDNFGDSVCVAFVFPEHLPVRIFGEASPCCFSLCHVTVGNKVN